jgi:hypothetical protein
MTRVRWAGPPNADALPAILRTLLSLSLSLSLLSLSLNDFSRLCYYQGSLNSPLDREEREKREKREKREGERENEKERERERERLSQRFTQSCYAVMLRSLRMMFYL